MSLFFTVGRFGFGGALGGEGNAGFGLLYVSVFHIFIVCFVFSCKKNLLFRSERLFSYRPCAVKEIVFFT